MTANQKRLALALALGCAAWPAIGLAQEQQPRGDQDIVALGRRDLRDAVQKLYEDALAATRNQAVISANDSRYLWATEAKVQCAIALGYLKSGYKDPISINNCADAADLMDDLPTQPLSSMEQGPTPVTTVTPEICRQQIAGTVFFDFDSIAPGADATQTVAFIAQNMQPCGRSGLDVVGHADRSGSDSYNDALSMRRAQAVAAMLTAAGVPGSALAVSGRGEQQPRVPTPDGVRNPQNRRVEIVAK